MSRKKISRPVLAFEKPAPPPPMTAAEKYIALSRVTPDCLFLVNHTIDYLFDLEKRRNPSLFVTGGGR